jgi:hypothetical protein
MEEITLILLQIRAIEDGNHSCEEYLQNIEESVISVML